MAKPIKSTSKPVGPRPGETDSPHLRQNGELRGAVERREDASGPCSEGISGTYGDPGPTAGDENAMRYEDDPLRPPAPGGGQSRKT
jgi:hypothetical protein